jgi:hypothetical protein
MDLVAHLLATRTPLQLAKELAATAKENAALRDQLHAAKHEIFWLRVREEGRPIPEGEIE